MLLSLLSAVGMGFAFAGRVFIYKRVENAFTIVQFGLVGLVGAPAERLAWLKLLPLSQGSHLLRIAITDGVRLWEFPLFELVALLGVSLVYFIVGYAVFDRAVRKARRDGLLGHN